VRIDSSPPLNVAPPWWEEALNGLSTPAAVIEALRELHETNARQWHLEDRVRQAPDDQIPAIKRQIDAHNRQRHGLIERIDERLAGLWAETAEGPPLSESIGSALDRLSILTLRIANSVQASAAKGTALERQRADLVSALRKNRGDLVEGLRRAPDHRRFKQYDSAPSGRS
jgi:hypothetical protein